MAKQWQKMAKNGKIPKLGVKFWAQISICVKIYISQLWARGKENKRPEAQELGLSGSGPIN